jgi:hypothetical protein
MPPEEAVGPFGDPDREGTDARDQGVDAAGGEDRLMHVMAPHALATEAYTMLYENESSLLSTATRLQKILEELESFDGSWTPHREACARVCIGWRTWRMRHVITAPVLISAPSG